MIVNKQLAESKGHHQSDLWRTPMPIFRKLDNQFGFTLDPCCTEETALCAKFYTPNENGLDQNWEGEKVYCNPPYSRGNIDLWVEKCYAESKKTNTGVVALLPVSTSAKWWHKWIIGKAGLWFVERRIRFVGAPFTAPFSSVIVLWNRNDIASFKQPICQCYSLSEMQLCRRKCS